MRRRSSGWALRWVLAVVLLACSHCFADIARPGLQRPGRGALVGRVTIGPLPPGSGTEGVRPPGPVPGGSSAPVAGARIVVSPLVGGSVQSMTTDDRGEYAISLVPGTYRVTMEVGARIGLTKDLPATVAISEGKETRLDVRVDTGIR